MSRRSIAALFEPGSSVWGFADQSLQAAANFVLLIFTARVLGPHEFGIFSLSYALLQFILVIQSSSITQPHNVIGSSLPAAEYRKYTTSTAICQAGFAVASLLLFLVVGQIVGVWKADLVSLLAITGLAGFFWQLQELGRRILYTEGRLRLAFLNDLATNALMVIGLVLIHQQRLLSPTTTMLALSLAFALGTAMVLVSASSSWTTRLTRSEVRRYSMQNWNYGKWLTGGAAMFWFSSQSFPYMVAIFTGPAAAGGLRAVLTLFGPTSILTRTVESVVPARIARLSMNTDFERCRKYATKAYLPVLTIIVAYLSILTASSSRVMPTLLGSSYSEFGWMVAPLSVYFLLYVLYSWQSTILRSTFRTRPIFVAQGVSSGVVLVLGIVLVSAFGLKGAVAGWIGGGLVLCSMLAVTLKPGSVHHQPSSDV